MDMGSAAIRQRFRSLLGLRPNRQRSRLSSLENVQHATHITFLILIQLPRARRKIRYLRLLTDVPRQFNSQRYMAHACLVLAQYPAAFNTWQEDARKNGGENTNALVSRSAN